METTVEVILDFLRRNNFSNAESALRAELMAMREGAQPPFMVDELPRLPPVRIQPGKRNCNDNKDDDNPGGVNSTTSFDSAVFLSTENTPEGFFTLGSSSSSSGGVKNLCGTRPSTSQAMFEDQLSDQLSGFATAVSRGDCLSEFALNYPFQCWDDSDTYENDDDPGYHRQPIEDKAWFLTHEIEHPNGDDEQGMLQNGCNLNESLANLEGDTKSFVEEEPCSLPADENKLRNPQKERAQPNNRGEIINSEAFDLLKTSNPWHHLSKEMQVKPSDEVWDDCGRSHHHYSTEIDGKSLSAAKPDNILVNNDVVVSGDESMGVESNGEMENPRKEDLEVEESMHGSYCQRSSFKECSKVSRIRHFDSEDEMVGPIEDVYEDQHRHHVYYNKSSRHILELQLPEQDLHENGSLLIGLNSSTKDYKCKSDESPCSSSTRSKETLGMGLFERSNLSSQTTNDYLCMGTKGESEVEETMHKEIAYEEFVGEEDEDMETMQNEIQATEEDEYEEFDLKIIHRKNRTGFEEEKDLDLVINSVIAGRYHVIEYLGSAAFSKAIQAHDLHSGMDVCMKIIKNNKDFFDQSLDEIKLLKYVNRHDPTDRYHILRLYDYFYHKEHLFIVCELLRANLYEFQKFNNESGGEAYFTMPRLQFIALQCLEALQFLHSLGIIHCDLKPENILVKSYSRCEIKVIDLGSSCFQTDQLCPYVQSRAYRAPEVILGLPYDQKIDIWSLGCILAELCSGNVLFQNDSVTTLLARIIGILGPIDPEMLEKGQDTHKYFTKNYVLYEQIEETEQLEYILPKKTSLSHRLPTADAGFLEFVDYLLQINPTHRPTAKEALDHPWISYPYEPISS